MKHFILSAMDRLGIEAQRSTTLRRYFATHSIDLVVDAGANIGQFGQLVRRKGYRGRIWSFEPVWQAYQRLKDFVREDPNWSLTTSALGNFDGKMTINVSTNHTLSSFLPSNEEFMSQFSGFGESVAQEVYVRRLDTILEGQDFKHIFLKADVQGFEKQVLEGAPETLKHTDAIYLELPIEHLYEGSWSFPEAITYLDDLGFTPAQFRTVNSLPNDRASAVEFDVLFRRK